VWVLRNILLAIWRLVSPSATSRATRRSVSVRLSQPKAGRSARRQCRTRTPAARSRARTRARLSESPSCLYMSWAAFSWVTAAVRLPCWAHATPASSVAHARPSGAEYRRAAHSRAHGSCSTTPRAWALAAAMSRSPGRSEASRPVAAARSTALGRSLAASAPRTSRIAPSASRTPPPNTVSCRCSSRSRTYACRSVSVRVTTNPCSVDPPQDSASPRGTRTAPSRLVRRVVPAGQGRPAAVQEVRSAWIVRHARAASIRLNWVSGRPRSYPVTSRMRRSRYLSVLRCTDSSLAVAS